MSLEEVYSPKYCQQLEAAYGKNMMSEGGDEVIKHLFDSVDMQGKKVLDIGSGLGGVAFYISWMVAEAKRRTHCNAKGVLVVTDSG